MTNEKRLEVLSAQIDKLSGQNKDLLVKKQKAQSSLAVLDSQRKVLVSALAGGGHEGTVARLDEIDVEEKALRRQIAGLDLLIAEKEKAIAQLDQERAPILVAVQTAAVLKEVRELTEIAEEQFDLVESLQEQLAAALFELPIAVNKVRERCYGRADCVDFSNRMTLRSEPLARRMHLKIVNEGWQTPTGPLWVPREVAIPACLPPANAASKAA